MPLNYSTIYSMHIRYNLLLDDIARSIPTRNNTDMYAATSLEYSTKARDSKVYTTATFHSEEVCIGNHTGMQCTATVEVISECIARLVHMILHL